MYAIEGLHTRGASSRARWTQAGMEKKRNNGGGCDANKLAVVGAIHVQRVSLTIQMETSSQNAAINFGKALRC